MKISTLFSVAVCCMTLTSCLKGSSTDEQAPYVSIINTSPTLGTFNIYLDGTAVNSAAIPFGAVIAYSQVTAGDHTLKFTTAGSTESLLTKTITLSGDKIYSFYLVDKEDQMDGLLLEDHMTVSSTEKAFVRFINLSPDAPALSLSITDGSTLFSGENYKGSTEFAAIDPNTYNFSITESATTELRASINSVTFSAGKYYTVISRGMLEPGSIDQSFSGQVIINL